MSEPTLELSQVSKRFDGFQAVQGLSFAVPAGTIFGLLGPNGAGKTTTLRMIMDILAPDQGEIRLFGRPRHGVDPRRIGYLPEERGLYRKMSVEDQLLFLAQLSGLSRSQAAGQITEWLARVGLADRARAKLETLSKGMQQKIQIVATTLHDPDFLILDEPFSGLDPINQGLFREVMAEFKQRGKTILFSTHILEHAERLCDHICLISGGRSVLAGELATLKRERGGTTFRLVATGDLARLPEIPGIARAVVDADGARLWLAPGELPGGLLRRLVEFLEVREFHPIEPNLETLFLEAVGDEN